MEEHFVGEVGQKALIEREGKVLMCQSVGETGWDFPGGRLNVGEEPMAGLRRELQEELYLEELEIEQPLYTCVYTPKSGIPRYFVLYVCTLGSNVERIQMNEAEIAAVRWVSPEEIETVECPPQWKDALRLFFSRRQKL